ncbi:MAG: PEP-CTERM system histidine kinase PrsK [Alphaproteobacteria bacterium]|nr:PEP-CTERM system histidine kinase PrsK [Alphaproteobacteria bacterium]
MPLSAAFYTHAAAALGYAVFVGLLAFRGARSWLTALLAVAATVTALWSLTWTLADLDLLPMAVPMALAPLRDGSWLAVVLGIFRAADEQNALWRRLAVLTAVAVAVDIAFGAFHLNFGTIGGIQLDSEITRIVVSILGLVLVENLLRNMSIDQFWSTKLLGIGLTAIFVFNLVLRIPQFLTHMPDQDLVAAQPLIFILVLPLFVVTAVRTPLLRLGVHSSRKIVFHTAALVSAGVLLQGTAIAAYYIRNYGGSSATILSVLLIFVMLVGLAVAVSSASFRSYAVRFINENFFSYKYDYRVEWQKFIQSLSAWEDGDVPLRVLRTLSELLDSNGGALWSFRESWNQFMPVAKWSFPGELAPIARDAEYLKCFENEDLTYLELQAAESEPGQALWHEMFPAAWLAVPLRYRSSLVGVAVLNRPRVIRPLDWEDRNLIGLVAMQLSAYLVQEETAQALADARQLEEFNKRVAFILHDIKNTIGQLSLIARNAERFGHREEFRKDMVLTIQHSVDQLQELLARLRGEPVADAGAQVSAQGTDICNLIADFALHKRSIGLDIELDLPDAQAFARVPDHAAFLSVLEHVFANAVEASPSGTPVSFRLTRMADHVRIDIADKGAGMTPQFIAQELFRPLRSTKGKGLGIGAYQARETMRRFGGDIEVSSVVGQGTTVSLVLPVSKFEEQRIPA